MQAKCIGCKMCVQACPFGNASWDFLTSADPQVRHLRRRSRPASKSAPARALEWVADTVSAQARKRAFAAKLKNAFLEA